MMIRTPALLVRTATTCFLLASSLPGTGITPDPAVLAEVQRAWSVADGQLQRTLAYLDMIEPAGIYYPQHTENEVLKDDPVYAHGEWIVREVDSSFWAKGAFPGMLFLMAARETDPVKRQSLIDAGADFATPLLGTGSGDMAMNSLFVLRPWYHLAADSVLRDTLSLDIQRGASLLAEPFVKGTTPTGDTGRFHEDIRLMGYRRNNYENYFHAFVDHSPNVEQLLYAARLTDDPAIAEDYRNKALDHIRELGKAFRIRNPGSSGTWQRGFFDFELSGPGDETYFNFNLAKQGHDHHTTWSRGQAWYIYGSSAAYAYTRDATLLPYVKEQLDYFLANLPDRFPGDLRRPGKMVPPWDFDYALFGDTDPGHPEFGIPKPDTEVDTSAAAMALAGILQLVAALPEIDPDRARYLDDAEAILLDLCSDPYLCDDGDPEMSILRHGCYHHSECVEYPGLIKDNGLVWGDFLFVYALWCYLDLTEDKGDSLETLEIVPVPSTSGQYIVRYTRPIGSLPFGFQFEMSHDLINWEPLSPDRESVTPAFDGTETVELFIEPGTSDWGTCSIIRAAR